MVTMESFLSSRAFHREIEQQILSKLGKVTAVALSVYLVLKVEDLVNYNLGSYLTNFNLEGILYWAEILIGVIIPIALLVIPKIRGSKRGLYYSALLTVIGFVLNRMNVSITSLERYDGVSYFPSWMEISVTLMIVAIGFAAFAWAAKNLSVFPKEENKTIHGEGYEVAIIDNPLEKVPVFAEMQTKH